MENSVNVIALRRHSFISASGYSINPPRGTNGGRASGNYIQLRPAATNRSESPHLVGGASFRLWVFWAEEPSADADRRERGFG